MSPSHNSSPTGWSPIKMPPEATRRVSSKTQGIVGTNTRQRAPLIGHPLCLHYISEGRTAFMRISAPHPSPDITGGRSAGTPVNLY